MKRMVAAAVVLLAGTVSAPLSAQGGYGTAVAAAGDVLFVAEPHSITRPGTIYAYVRDGSGRWVEQGKLNGPDPRPGDRFGQSVAAFGAAVVTGNPSAGNGTGAAWVFERSGAQWRQSALAVTGAAPGDSVGAAVSVHDNVAAVSAPGGNAVYVLRRAPDGRWAQEGKLTGTGVQAGDRFGAAVAVRGDVVLVGAPGREASRGSAFLFRREGGSWKQETELRVGGAADNDGAGRTVALVGDHAIVGAPGRDNGSGAVFAFVRAGEANSWTQTGRLVAYDGGPGAGFGAALASSGNELWVGVPGRMSVHRFAPDERTGRWWALAPVRYAEQPEYTTLGGAVAAADNAAVAGLPHLIGGGAAVAFARQPDGSWAVASPLSSAPEEFPAVTGGRPLPCSAGKSASFECGGTVELLSFLPISALGGGPGVHVNDIWGWTDPTTNREYALLGRADGTSFVDVTDPQNPKYLGNLPLHQGARPNLWRDIKVYRDHAFVVADGAGPHGMQVFDLTQLRTVTNAPVTFTETAHYDGIASAHNIAINEETGTAFAVGNRMGGNTCGGGLHIIDIRDPKKPAFGGCFADPGERGNSSATHDTQCVTYRGPDQEYAGREICFNSNGSAFIVVDVTDRARPVALARTAYPNLAYSHQGWLTADQRYFYMNDEGDELAGTVPRTRTIIWDVSELDDPQIVGEYLGETAASDHNLYVRGDTLFESNYKAGLRIIDISDRTKPREIGFFDSVPNSENSPGFQGSWSNYPYFRSGTIIFSSIREGLFVVRLGRPIS